MDYTVGTKVLDGWEIIRPIGAGSYGKVFEVHKTSYDVETVSALKVISIPDSQADVRSAMSDGMDERSVTTYFKGFVDQFLHEIAIMSTLKSHPNIVGYEDHHLIEYPNEIHWDILIRMELLTPLDQYQQDVARRAGLAQGGTMPVEEVVRLGRELCSALAFCQRKNIIHRDIKPENIFVSETGQFKLGDFGTAKTAAARSTGGSRKGTERYMAPELYMNEPYGPTVDLYSLGLVMYRLLNGGRLPFLLPAPKPLSFSDYENAQIRRTKGEPVPPPAQADEQLAAIILKACAFHSVDRYRSAGEMLSALDSYSGVNTPPPDPAPPPSSERNRVSGEWHMKGSGGTVGGGWRDAPPPPPGSGTIGGGWRDAPPPPPGGGTVGGSWRDAPPPPPGGGTVGGGWRDAKKQFDDAVKGESEKKGAPNNVPMARDELMKFWRKQLEIIRIPKQMPYLYFAPDIPRDLLEAALKQAGDSSDPSTVIGMISFRNKPKGSILETGLTFGAPFWGLYVGETRFGLIGKKKSDAISNIVSLRYNEIKDAKVLYDESIGFHKLKLLTTADRVLMFSPEVASDHYNYEALCRALLELRDRFT